MGGEGGGLAGPYRVVGPHRTYSAVTLFDKPLLFRVRGHIFPSKSKEGDACTAAALGTGDVQWAECPPRVQMVPFQQRAYLSKSASKCQKTAR